MRHDTPSIAEALSEVFLHHLLGPEAFRSKTGLADFEEQALREGFELIRHAMSLALEKLDDHLYRHERPAGCSVHDRKARTLLTEVGQVSFRRRAYRNREGAQFCLLDECLSIPPGSRISPGAFGMVRDDALCDAYARAGELLCRHTRASLSRRAVADILKESARAIQEQERRSTYELFAENKAPEGKNRADGLCVEADGTWVSLQREAVPRMEVKAMCAYTHKAAAGKRTRREGAVFFADVLPKDSFWKRSVARLGGTYSLDALKRVHLGTDGAAWCKAGGDYFPDGVEVIGHLDPWHLKRAVSSCLDGGDAAWVWRLLGEGQAQAAADAVGLCSKSEKACALQGYILNNAGIIGVEGPSMGTIEGDNSRYKDRLAGRRSWSLSGLSAMATLMSAKAGGMDMPARSTGQAPRRTKRYPLYSLRNVACSAADALQSDGSGYEPPSGHIHQKGTEDGLYLSWVINGRWQ